MADFEPPRDRAPVQRAVLWPRFDASEPTSWLLNVALLIVLCVVVMAIASVALKQWRPSPVASAAGGAIPSTPGEAQPSPERALQRMEITISEELDKQTRLKEQQAADARREAAVKAREASEAAALQAAALEARREREWQAFYKKPAACDPALPNMDSVSCANDYIRARRAFDERFISTSRR